MFQSVLDSLQIFPIIYELHLHKISTYVIYTLFLRLYLYYLRKTCYTDWRLLIPFPPTPSLAKYHTLYPAQRVSNLSLFLNVATGFILIVYILFYFLLLFRLTIHLLYSTFLRWSLHDSMLDATFVKMVSTRFYVRHYIYQFGRYTSDGITKE